MSKKPKPPLKLVTSSEANWADPPRSLGQHGRHLWDRIQREYVIDDAGGVELLLLACEGTDRIAALREQIAHDGAVIRQRSGGIKEHPALKAEIAAMSFVTRTLTRLGLDVEPVRSSVGRPGGGIGWTP